MNKIIYLLSLLFTQSLIAQDLGNLKKEKLADISGSIGLSTTGYTASGIKARRVPFSWLINTNLNVKLKGVELPFSFLLTEQQRDFRQPFNQFGLSPKWKNLQLHLGWRNLAYSNYTLNNYQFLGAGADFKFKKLQLSAMHGKLLKAVAEDSTKSFLNNGAQVPLAAYNRFASAINICYVGKKNYFNIVLLKGSDKQNSLISKPIKNVIAPAENAVIGLKYKFTFAKNLEWENDAAFSAYTRDTRAAAYPLDKEKFIKSAEFLFKPKLSSSYYYAIDNSLAWNTKQYGIKIKYQRILPDYKSMGTYFIQSDVDRKTLEARWSDTKNTFMVNGSFGIEKDNLTNKKIASTARNIGSLNINYNPNPKFGLQASYSTYGTTQSPGLKSVSDTVKLDQVTNSIIIVPRYTLIKPKTVQNFVLSLSNQKLNDNNRFNSENFEMNVISATLSYAISFIKTGLSIDASPLYLSSKNIMGNTESFGGSLGASKAFLKNKLGNSLSASYTTNTFNKQNNGYTLQARTNSSYRYNKHNRFILQLSHVINRSKNILSSRTFNESTGMLQYIYSF